MQPAELFIPELEISGAALGSFHLLEAFSKNLTGTINRLGPGPKIQNCTDARGNIIGTTQRGQYRLSSDLASNLPCDAGLGELLKGKITVSPLALIFRDNGQGRGYHTGRFEWFDRVPKPDFRIHGHLSGVVNLGTHRPPAFPAGGQACNDVYVWEGRLTGRVVSSTYTELKEALVVGAYRLKLEPYPLDPKTSPFTGVLEGMLVRPCPS